MGGLAAAKAVAPHFEKVTVLDRDVLPEGPAPRAGTPQARHLHVLLAGGQKALEELFPGFCGDLERAGAVSTRVGRDLIFEWPGYDPFPRRDLGFDAFCLSRPLLESLCRRRLMEEPNVDLRPKPGGVRPVEASIACPRPSASRRGSVKRPAPQTCAVAASERAGLGDVAERVGALVAIGGGVFRAAAADRIRARSGWRGRRQRSLSQPRRGL